MKLFRSALLVSCFTTIFGFAPMKTKFEVGNIHTFNHSSETSLDAATTSHFSDFFSKSYRNPLARAPTKVIEPSYDLATFFGAVGMVIILANPGDSCSVSMSACLPSFYGVLAGGIHIMIAAFFGYQARKIRCVFDDSSFELKRFDLAPNDKLKSQGENFVLGGKNRWKYDKFVNWKFFPSKEFPILVYFKETQTPKKQWTSPFGLDKRGGGQVHFFPAFANVNELAEEFERRGCAKM